MLKGDKGIPLPWKRQDSQEGTLSPSKAGGQPASPQNHKTAKATFSSPSLLLSSSSHFGPHSPRFASQQPSLRLCSKGPASTPSREPSNSGCWTKPGQGTASQILGSRDALPGGKNPLECIQTSTDSISAPTAALEGLEIFASQISQPAVESLCCIRPYQVVTVTSCRT